MKNKNILIIVAIALIGLTLVGSTYAYLTFSLDITNDNYNNISTHCFGITYNVNNIDGSTDITGTLFPSSTPSKGLTGRVGFSSDETCSITGLGTIKLNIASTTSSTLTTPASSYCESRSTLEPMTEYTTEAACSEAGGRWRGYGDAYCENPNTLERMEDYTTESECTTNSGTWVTGGSPLKYAVYTSTDASASPVSVGRINSTDIGNTITIYDNFSVTQTMTYYYIYIWLDGYLTDNTHTNLPFEANITASVRQNPNAAPVPITRYAYSAPEAGFSVSEKSFFPYDQVNLYNTEIDAINDLDTRAGQETSYGIFLRHKIEFNSPRWCTDAFGNGKCRYVYNNETECRNHETSNYICNLYTIDYVIENNLGFYNGDEYYYFTGKADDFEEMQAVADSLASSYYSSCDMRYGNVYYCEFNNYLLTITDDGVTDLSYQEDATISIGCTLSNGSGDCHS